MILSYQSIKSQCSIEGAIRSGSEQLLTPFLEEKISHGMTAGLSSAGYDIRIDQDVTLYPITLYNLILNSIGIKRPSFLLASSIERFSIPSNLLAMVSDKSTWARRGLAVQNTIAEPGWKGWLTLELSNHGSNTLHIKKGSPIAQIIFFKLDQPSEKPYSGKYQLQKRGPQNAILV